MDRLVVIANPVASQFTGGSHRDVMATISRTHHVESLWPASATETSEKAANAAADGVSVVVAMGGDGMVHHVAQGLVDTEAALGIIPVGTTNVVARILNVPSKPSKAARLTTSEANIRTVGVAQMQLIRGSTETIHHAVFACGLGLDAEVVIEANRDPYRKYRFGSLHYGRAALGVGLKTFPSRKPHLTINSEGRNIEGTAALVQFRDIYTYFGKIPIKLASQPPNPMTALVVKRLRRHRIPQIAANAFTGHDLGAIKGFDTWQEIESITVSADPPVAAQADGESLGMVDTATITWTPDVLRVITGSFGK
jgi:diacylglycerol kinase family enzyme